jgi:hypothetical protein
MMETDMDYDSIAKAGSMLGSGAVIVMDETRCMVKSLLRLSYFYLRRILRPVHAVPRRHRLAVPHGAPYRARPGPSGRHRLLNNVATTSRAAPSARSAKPPRCRWKP